MRTRAARRLATAAARRGDHDDRERKPRLLRPLRRRHQRGSVPDVPASARRGTDLLQRALRRVGVVAARRRREGPRQLGDVLQQSQRHPRDHQERLRTAVRRRDVRGSAGAHDAPRPDVARVHAAAHERARGPGAGVLLRVPRPARRRRSFRLRQGSGRADADARHRHAARAFPRATSPRCATRRTRPLRTEAGKPMEVQQNAIADGSMFADYIEWRARAPGRRLDDGIAQRGVRGRHRYRPHAQPRRGARVHTGHRGCGQRDHGPAHRLAREGPRRPRRTSAVRSSRTAH